MKRVLFILAMLCVAASAFAQSRVLLQSDTVVNLRSRKLHLSGDTTGKTGYLLGVKAGGGIDWIVSGGSITTPISIANGGTNATSAAAAFTNLVQDTTAHTGLPLSTKAGGGYQWVLLPVASGGTGAATAAAARVNILPDTTGQTGKKLTVKAGGGFDWE